MPELLSLAELQAAVSGPVAAFRRRLRLQPAGGPGDKVFPPTYMGAVYAIESRVIDGESKRCVILDSVPSQANRMEEALQQAVDAGRLELPRVVVDFSGAEGLLGSVGRITTLEAPHRLADAIIRDSFLDGEKFRESGPGAALNDASYSNATPVFALAPNSLVLGMWDSHGPRGGLGAKFERTLVSEIVGVGAEFGLRTGGRIDPLGIQRQAGPIYESKYGWTLDEAEAVEEKGKPKKVGDGRPSEIGHGNVAPTFAEYGQGAQGPDPFTGGPAERLRGIAPGGVTMEYALQTTVLSLPALRRLRFPVDGQPPTAEVDSAARTVLAALALCSATLASESGYDLRSRCALWPEEEPSWEILERPGSEHRSVTLDGAAAIDLFGRAAESARKAGLPWSTDPLVLQPSPELVDLVRRSQTLVAGEGASDEGE